MKSFFDQPKFEESGVTSLGSLSDCELTPLSQNPCSAQPISRQFWNAGDYVSGHDLLRVSQCTQNRLRIHPKFLHSNATSHKWAFGAVAELLDNAVDEVKNGATFVYLDKITNPRDGNPALLVQDNGGGMDPESLRHCMSFGFSDKHSSSIGQYGNGFKTSTMRLGADVIVFSRCINQSTLTQSVGLLSYTFLRQTGADDVVVPMVDYKFNASTGLFERMFRRGPKEFSVNLSTLLSWSPFSTEESLLKNCDDMGHQGTKVIVFNLWYNDKGEIELDFNSDPQDILVNGPRKPFKSNSSAKLLNENHIAKRLRYSLRAYSSVLYLHTPPNFRIILRGHEVADHCLAEDLKFFELIKYRPQVGGRMEAEVDTIIGFLKDAPKVDIHGFNIYHKNRLILPFCPVVHGTTSCRGRGVSGVLEANFIKPTHDKQGFEKSVLFTKLETRLKEMTFEYWQLHSHKIGYSTASPVFHLLPPPTLPSNEPLVKPLSSIPRGVSSECSPGEQTGTSGKRRQESQEEKVEPSKRQVVEGKVAARHENNPSEPGPSVGHKKLQTIEIMLNMKKKLRADCSKYEESEKELLLKAQELRQELEELEQINSSFMNELNASGFVEIKLEKP